MAQKRMFSLQIVDTDAFLEMPVSSQLLYFHLSMRADDDGFVSNPKKIMRIIGTQEDDLKVLIAKRFILTFESGVIVIKHWRINNYIQNDRYAETKYIEEKKSLTLKDNGAYTECIQNVSSLDTQYRLDLDKVRLDKIRKEEREETPAHQTEEFFNSEMQLQVMQQLTEKGMNEQLAKREINKFINYWTEKNKVGKQRWQGEKFFEINRRLATWFSRVKDFNQPQETKGIRI